MEKDKTDPAFEGIIKMLDDLARKEGYEGIVPPEGAIPEFLMPAYKTALRKYRAKSCKENDQRKSAIRSEAQKRASQASSERMKKRWKDADTAKKHLEAIRQGIAKRDANPTFSKTRSAKMTERMKKSWQDPEYVKTKSERMKKQWQDPAFRKLRSAVMKKKWQDPEYRKAKSEGMRKLVTDPEFKRVWVKQYWNPERRRLHAEKMSEVMKKKWKDNPEFAKASAEASRQRMRQRLLKQWQDPEYRKAQSERMSQRMKKMRKENPEWAKALAETVSRYMKQKWTDPAYRKERTGIVSKQLKRQWANPEWRAMRIDIAKRPRSISRYDHRRSQEAKGVSSTFDYRSREFGLATAKGPQSELIEKELCSAVREAVMVLPALLREFVILSFFEAKSLEEISQQTGLPEEEIGKGLEQAYKTLAPVLEEFK